MPEPEMPFLITFTDFKNGGQRSSAAPKMFVSPAKRLLLDPTPSSPKDKFAMSVLEEDEKHDDSLEIDRDESGDSMDEGLFVKEIVHDPTCCTLSQQIFGILTYKEPLIKLLEWRLRGGGNMLFDDDIKS